MINFDKIPNVYGIFEILKYLETKQNLFDPIENLESFQVLTVFLILHAEAILSKCE